MLLNIQWQIFHTCSKQNNNLEDIFYFPNDLQRYFPNELQFHFSASKGHRRQGSYNDSVENLDVEVEIYITQLSALLKLMQVNKAVNMYK